MNVVAIHHQGATKILTVPVTLVFTVTSIPVKINCQAKRTKNANVNIAAKHSNHAFGFAPRPEPKNLMLTFRRFIRTAGNTAHIIMGNIILPQSKKPGILGRIAHLITASNIVRNEINTKNINPTEAKTFDKVSNRLCRCS